MTKRPRTDTQDIKPQDGAPKVAECVGMSGRMSSDIPGRMLRNVQISDDLGITPAFGAGGKVRGMTAGALEKFPLAGDAIAKDAVRFVGEIKGVASRLKSSLGQANVASEAGATLQSGLRAFVDRGKNRSSELYDKVGEFFAAYHPSPPEQC